MFKKISLCALAISNLVCNTNIYASGNTTTTTSPDGKTFVITWKQDGNPLGLQLDTSPKAKTEQLYNRFSSTIHSILERTGMLFTALTSFSNNKHSLFALGAASLACSAAYECLDQIKFDSKLKDSKMEDVKIGTLMLGAALGGALASRSSGGIMIASSLGVAGCCLTKTMADKLMKGVSQRAEPSEEKSILARIAGFAGDMKKNLSSACEMVAKPLAFYAAGKFFHIPSSIVYPATAGLVVNNMVSSCIKINKKDSIKESLIKRGFTYVVTNLGLINTDTSSESNNRQDNL